MACLLCTLPLLGKLKHVEPYLHPQRYEGDTAGSRFMEEEEVSVAASDDEEEGVSTLPMATAVFLHHDEREERMGESKTPDETAGIHSPSSLSEVASSSSASVSYGSFLSTLCFQDLCTWPFFFILTTTLCFYAAFLPFETFAVDFLKSDLHFSAAQASLGASLIPFLSVIVSPPVGALVDRELTPYLLRDPRRAAWLTWVWPPGSTQLWAMLLTALGLFVTTLAPVAWIEGFTLVSLGYALSCASLWTVRFLFSFLFFFLSSPPTHPPCLPVCLSSLPSSTLPPTHPPTSKPKHPLTSLSPPSPNKTNRSFRTSCPPALWAWPWA